MLQVRTVFLLLLQFNVVYITEAGYYLDINFNNATLEAKSKKVKSCHAELAIVDEHQVINAFIEYSENIKVVKARATLDIIRGTRNYRIYDVFIDFCKVIKERGKMSMILIIYNQFSSFGYVPHSCPLVAHINYTITNFRIDTEQIPIYTPRMNFVFNVKVFYGKEYIFDIYADGVLESKMAKKVKKPEIP